MPSGAMVQAVADVGCVHAQVGASAEIMLGLRVAGITREDIRAALWRQRSLVKTVGLRGTLHLVPAEEVPVWMAANRLRFDAERRRIAKYGIDPAELNRLVDAIADVVGPQPIGRPELEQAIEARVGAMATMQRQAWAGDYPSWPFAMGFASALGRICYGPGQGGRSTFVRLADWSGWRDEDPLDSGVAVLRRFMHAYAPSTEAEFARWFALETPVVKQLFARLAPELAEVDVEGSRRWMLASDVTDTADLHPHAVHLLPQFDVYVVGSLPREQLIPPGTPIARLRMGTAAPFAVLAVGGQVAGVWERRARGKNLVIRVDAHRPLKPRQKEAVARQAERVAEILGSRCELEFGEVALKAHL